MKKMMKHHYLHSPLSARSKASAQRKGKQLFRIPLHRNLGIPYGAAWSKEPPWNPTDTTCRLGLDKQSVEQDSRDALVPAAAKVQVASEVPRKVMKELAHAMEHMAWAKQELEQSYSSQLANCSN